MAIIDIHIDYISEIAELPSQIAKYKRQLKYVVRFYISLIIFVFLLIVVQGVLTEIVHNENLKDYIYADSNVKDANELMNQMERLQNIMISLTYVFLGGLGLYTTILAHDNVNRLKTLIKNKFLIPIKDNEEINVREAVRNLCNKMLIEYKIVMLWRSKSLSKYPSVEEVDGNINLILPIGFLIDFKKDNNKGNAILAHELGHVLQHDTDLYLIADTNYSILRKYFVPLIFLNVLMQIILFFYLASKSVPISALIVIALLIIIGIVVYVILTDGFKRIRELRHSSEMYADTAALIFTNYNDILSCLHCLVEIHSANNNTHPYVEDRIENIEKIGKNYEIV